MKCIFRKPWLNLALAALMLFSVLTATACNGAADSSEPTVPQAPSDPDTTTEPETTALYVVHWRTIPPVTTVMPETVAVPEPVLDPYIIPMSCFDNVVHTCYIEKEHRWYTAFFFLWEPETNTGELLVYDLSIPLYVTSPDMESYDGSSLNLAITYTPPDFYRYTISSADWIWGESDTQPQFVLENQGHVLYYEREDGALAVSSSYWELWLQRFRGYRSPDYLVDKADLVPGERCAFYGAFVEDGVEIFGGSISQLSYSARETVKLIERMRDYVFFGVECENPFNIWITPEYKINTQN